jgi:hypothetical protein
MVGVRGWLCTAGICRRHRCNHPPAHASQRGWSSALLASAAPRSPWRRWLQGRTSMLLLVPLLPGPLLPPLLLLVSAYRM